MATLPAPLTPLPEVAEDASGGHEVPSSSGADDRDGDDKFERPPGPHDTAVSRSSALSRGGSWYFQPDSPGDAAGALPPGALPPHLAYWMPGEPGTEGGPPPPPPPPDMPYSMPYPNHYQMPPPGYYPETFAGSAPDLTHLLPPDEEFKVYRSRWVMLFYMSLLNLLSDWTCFSVSPIARLTTRAFGLEDPDRLVTVFLFANALASAMEPAILGRLGLRKTVLFGAFILMLGSIVKSGGMKIMGSSSPEELEEEEESIVWRLYLGFFLVGLSQPLYQCTPALLSASWFPENERTMATGMALNSNQLGIGCAFVFSMMVRAEEDILPYFGALSIIATVTFVGVALQFEDAPPTPPSDTARVIKGDLVIKLPRHFTKFMGRFINLDAQAPDASEADAKGGGDAAAAASVLTHAAEATEGVGATKDDDGPEDPVPEDAAAPPSGAAPRAPPNPPLQSPGDTPPVTDSPQPHPNPTPYATLPSPGNIPADPGMGMGYSTTGSSFYHGYDQEGHYHNSLLDGGILPFADDAEDEGAEPILTQLDHELDIDIRDDQIVQQFKACFRRKGFAHCVVAFTTGGIIINSLSTFMDYLVNIGPSKGGSMVGIVGGVFQALIMCSSLVIGSLTDHSRKYYFVILSMLVFGAFALSMCNVLLDSSSAVDLRWVLLLVAILAGPLQPIATELGVEVVYPLSENTVLVVQQLFSNLLSAVFIEIFKALKNVGTTRGGLVHLPEYTCSFYMLIIIHSSATCYFATFNGTYLRYEAELEKKANKEEEKERLLEDLHLQHEVARYGAMAPN